MGVDWGKDDTCEGEARRTRRKLRGKMEDGAKSPPDITGANLMVFSLISPSKIINYDEKQHVFPWRKSTTCVNVINHPFVSMHLHVLVLLGRRRDAPHDTTAACLRLGREHSFSGQPRNPRHEICLLRTYSSGVHGHFIYEHKLSALCGHLRTSAWARRENVVHAGSDAPGRCVSCLIFFVNASLNL